MSPSLYRTRKRGLTQAQAASELELKVMKLAKIEQGRANVTMQTEVRLARVFYVPLIELSRMPSGEAEAPRKSWV